jgi:integrase/recombinase XerC
LTSFLSGRSETTLKAYRQDLTDFAAFMGSPDPIPALSQLLASDAGQANALALAYRADLMNRGLKAATINRRMAALRSAVKMGRVLGLVSFTLEIGGVKRSPYRDTRGPGVDGFRAMVKAAKGQRGALAVRDLALLYLMRYMGLRRGEVAALDVGDVDLERGAVAVLGKGQTDKELITLPDKTKAALTAWLNVRGMEPGPLFCNFHHDPRERKRISGTGLWWIVRALGRKAGVRVRPHGLRHLCITDALEKTNGNYDLAARVSRHKDIRVLRFYNDSREDVAGRVGGSPAFGM